MSAVGVESSLIASTATTVPLHAAPPRAIAAALRGSGLWLDLGALVVRVRSDCGALPAQLAAAYREFPLVTMGEWADICIELKRARGLRRWLRPQVQLWCDSVRPFEPFPADTALPLLEWGTNFVIGSRLNHLWLLHAGVVERDGNALLLPATPGSGKSTLAAALSLRGWRLLSDEFGAYDPQRRTLRAILKPVALKNESIDVIRHFAPDAPIGPEFPKTRKGTVAHLAAKAHDVALRHAEAIPRFVILPKWQAGSDTVLEPIEPQTVFRATAFNAFNYEILGRAGFDSALDLARRCRGWRLVYSDLDDAIAAIGRLWIEEAA